MGLLYERVGYVTGGSGQMIQTFLLGLRLQLGV